MLKRGSATKTTYEPEFVQAQKYIEDLKTGVEKLIKNVKTNTNALGSTGGMNSAEHLAEGVHQCAEKLSTNIQHGASSDFVASLNLLNGIEKKVGQHIRTMQKRINDEVLSVLQQFISKTFANYKKQNNLLEKRRIDKDAAENAARRSGSGSVSESVEANFTEQKAAVQALIDEIPKWQEAISGAIITYLEICNSYHTACAPEFEATS